MKKTNSALRYAKALMQIGEEKNILDAIAAEFSEINAVINANEELQTVLESPLVNNAKKSEVFSLIFKELSADMGDFMRVLIENGRGAFIRDIYNTFLELHRTKLGIVSATLVSAVTLDEEQKAAILSKVGLTKEKTQLTESIDTSLIGGFVLTLGDRQIDASVSRRLTDMRVQLN